MNKNTLRNNYRVDADKLNFELHHSKLYEFCILGDYVIYHKLNGGDHYYTHIENLLKELFERL